MLDSRAFLYIPLRLSSGVREPHTLRPVEHMSHSARISAATRKAIRWSGVTAFLAATSLVVDVPTRGFTLSAILPAIIIATTGFQLINSHRLLSLIAPGEVRRWMRPLGVALYSLAALIALSAISTLVAHAAAP